MSHCIELLIARCSLVTASHAWISHTTENVPGVPGVGPKAAASLITELGSLEAVFADGMTPERVDTKLQASLQQLEGELARLAGEPVKLSSGAQIAKILGEKFGVKDLPSDKKGMP